jgi:hypothetical protein
MADIQIYTDNIKNAVYGEEVRTSIISAINTINTESSTANNSANTAYQAAKDNISDIAELEKRMVALENKNQDLTEKITTLETIMASSILDSTYDS